MENGLLHILILEDVPSDADLMEYELQEAGLRFTTKRVMTGDTFVKELEGFAPDLILSDYDLPQYTGTQALAEAKTRRPEVPFILVTGAIGEDRAIEIFTQGAKDYVLKGRLQRLAPAVRRVLTEVEELHARRKAEQERDLLLGQLELRIQEKTAALQASNEKIQSILNSITDIYVAYDRDWRFTDLNQQLERLVDRNRGDLLGKSLWETFPQLMETDFYVKYQEAMASEIPVHFDVFSPAANRWFETHAYPSRGGLDVYMKDISKRKQMEQEILDLSIKDQLTGLFNRRGFLALAEQQLKIAERSNVRLQLLFADLDGLKQINDSLGHRKGDEAIMEAADMLREIFRESDIVARVGGDEFVALALGVLSENSNALESRIQHLIDINNARTDRAYKISLSIGIVYIDPGNPLSIDELMSRADARMYEQKKLKNSKGLWRDGETNPATPVSPFPS